jgi:phage terminase small subunit
MWCGCCSLWTMENVRQQLATLNADDVDFIEGPTLTAKQERFAQVWARTDNQSAAYREVYAHEGTLPTTVWANSSRIAALPQVKARYHVLHEEAANETLLSLREALQWQIDIATADPNELVRVVADNCRHCHGIDYGYQWKNEDEYIDACVVAQDKNSKTTPTDVGGYGFVGNAAPNPTCPHCYGCGVERTVISDTTKLTGKARKLYAGAEQDRFGVIKIKMHDQTAAWDKVLRMRGAYNDKLDLRTPEQRAAETARAKLPDNITIEDASKAYIDLLG